MKGYRLRTTLRVEPHHQMLFSVILKTHWKGAGAYPSAEVKSAYSAVPFNRTDET